MILATYRKLNGQICIGAVHATHSRVLDLAAAAGRSGQQTTAVADMLSLIHAGPSGLDQARALLQRFAEEEELNAKLEDVTLLSPVPVPPQIRDFTVFTEHIRNAAVGMKKLAARLNGSAVSVSPPLDLEIPPIYRQQPVYYKGNRFSVVGSGAEVRWPRYSSFMDFEVEFGIFLGQGGRDIPKSRARDHIFGYTIFNDFSARDAQLVEMQGLLGPGKGKDFDTGNVIGPWIVTADEILDPYTLKMSARVNGETWCDGTASGMLHSFEDMIAFVSQSETLYPGEFFASGTMGKGCGLELDRYLASGDLVEVEVERIGVLKNRIFEDGAKKDV